MHVQVQAPDTVGPHPVVLYVHGATFPSANSIFFRFGGTSWADELNRAGFAVWGFDFAGYGQSERYPEATEAVPPNGEPLGRAQDAARQIERVVRTLLAETGNQRVSIIAHSWGTIAAGLFASQHPEMVDRLVFFGPIARRDGVGKTPALGPWRLLTIEDQHKRFVEDVPPGHLAVLLEDEFPAWAERYLDSDPASRTRFPPSVKVPSGPAADIAAAWSGDLAYDPAWVTAPILVVRGTWDSLCNDRDAAWLLSAMRRSPEKSDVKIDQATHLMHLEKGRAELYRATENFLRGK